MIIKQLQTFNLSIRIVESNANCAPLILIEPAVSQQDPAVIYIGPIEEIHNVSSMRPLENLDQVIGSKLSLSGKEDAFN